MRSTRNEASAQTMQQRCCNVMWYRFRNTGKILGTIMHDISTYVHTLNLVQERSPDVDMDTSPNKTASDNNSTPSYTVGGSARRLPEIIKSGLECMLEKCY